MLTWLLAGLLLIAVIVIWIQNHSIRLRSKQLQAIQHKLQHIRTVNSAEKLLVVTDDSEIIALLNEMGEWLEYHRRALAAHTKLEHSSRKMLSNISHDLKTPLTVVLGYLEALQLNPDMSTDERKLMLNKVHHKANEVLDLIQRFFDLVKLEAGDRDMPLKLLNISELCRTSILQYYDILSGKGIDVQIEIPDKTLHAIGNEEALLRVMDNLISNAIRYGSEGHTLGLHLSEDSQYVHIEVWDKGKGIHELHVDRVFERMYTLEDSRNRSFQGSGLGLTITKRLVQAMGGEITLMSKPYERTSFTVMLRKVNY